jgi:hypothetical protein
VGGAGSGRVFVWLAGLLARLPNRSRGRCRGASDPTGRGDELVTCTSRTHGHVVAGGRCVYCGQVVQASGVLTGNRGAPGHAWKSAPFLDATYHARCRSDDAPDGRHEPRDATGGCAECGTQLVGLGDVETGYRSRLLWFELPPDHMARND